MIETIFLFDDASWREQLLPLVATRPVSDLRVGIFTIAQKWRSFAGDRSIYYLTADYLMEKYGKQLPEAKSAVIIKGNVLPTDALFKAIAALPIGSVLMQEEQWIACRTHTTGIFSESDISTLQAVAFREFVQFIHYPEDIFMANAAEISADLRHIDHYSSVETLPQGNTYHGDKILMEGAHTFCGVTLHSEDGAIYIGAGAIIEDGVYIKGPAAICAGARVKTGARIYPNVTIGPGSTVCGEINNTVIWGNSAKGHEGYLGCAVIGEGCNLGAGTSNSNLRNDWKNVSLYDYAEKDYRNTGLQKCGLIMGDFTMVAIHTRFTTGTVIGVGAQIAISKFVPKFVPDFAWLTDDRSEAYHLDKFLAMMQRRDAKKINTMNPVDSRIFEYQHADTENVRKEYLYKLSK